MVADLLGGEDDYGDEYGEYGDYGDEAGEKGAAGGSNVRVPVNIDFI